MPDLWGCHYAGRGIAHIHRRPIPARNTGKRQATQVRTATEQGKDSPWSDRLCRSHRIDLLKVTWGYTRPTAHWTAGRQRFSSFWFVGQFKPDVNTPSSYLDFPLFWFCFHNYYCLFPQWMRYKEDVPQSLCMWPVRSAWISLNILNGWLYSE